MNLNMKIVLPAEDMLLKEKATSPLMSKTDVQNLVSVQRKNALFTDKDVSVSTDSNSDTAKADNTNTKILSAPNAAIVDLAAVEDKKLLAQKPMATLLELRQSVQPQMLAATAAETAEPGNSQPNGAYQINMETMYRDAISGKGQRRWYFFQTTAKKKITVYMSPVADASIDNDLALYKLDTSNGQLTCVAQSQNPAARYELLSYVADAGIYLVCVAEYAGDKSNEFSLMARLSDTWDSYEGDDSVLLAKEQPINATTQHTLDNTIDEDYSIWNVRTAGNYSVALFGVPASCNYQLQILNPAMQVLGTVAQNSRTTLQNVAVGSLILRVFSADQKVDPTATYTLLVTSIPSVIDVTDSRHYSSWLSADNKHVIEAMSIRPVTDETDSVVGVSIDGTPLNITDIDFKTTRYNTSYNTSECSLSTSNDTHIIGIAGCTYMGSHERRAINIKNPLLLHFDIATYAESHLQVTTTKRNNWSNAVTLNDESAELIFDLDTMAPADIYCPNWYFGDRGLTTYPPYGSPEVPGLSVTHGFGKIKIRK